MGISQDFTIYIEEIYGEDEWIAQHILAPNGAHLHNADEDHGRRTLSPLTLPPNSVRPRPGSGQTRFLNFSGPRLRGMREPERLQDSLYPLSIGLKMVLIENFALPVIPPALLGVAQSYVISEADVLPGELTVVCRRLRLAFALPEVRYDTQHIPYDYDTLTLHLAHLVNIKDDELLTEDHLVSLPGVHLNRPLDCARVADHLFVADGGTTEHPSAVRIWQMQNLPTPPGRQSV